MKIRLNGDERELPADSTVATVLNGLISDPRGVAVAVNGAVVPRATWDSRVLAEGDQVEVLTAAQGG